MSRGAVTITLSVVSNAGQDRGQLIILIRFCRVDVFPLRILLDNLLFLNILGIASQ
jgi:hypothetical protein